MTLAGVSRQTYCRPDDEAGASGAWTTYDRVRLKVTTVSAFHEVVKTVVARLIEACAVLAGETVEGVVNMTVARREPNRGIGPDECYSGAVLSGREEPNFAVDPSPGINRPSIYAALGVPEVWRYADRRPTYTARSADGRTRRSSDAWSCPSGGRTT